MKRVKVSKNFYADEFIFKKMYLSLGREAMTFIDPKLVKIAQLLRDKTGDKVVINNWWHNGSYDFSGLPPYDTYIGSVKSRYKLGQAIDVKVGDTTRPREVIELITAHWDDFKAVGLTTIEQPDFTPSWVHLDVRRVVGVEGILFVNP